VDEVPFLAGLLSRVHPFAAAGNERQPEYSRCTSGLSKSRRGNSGD
jgi:hypothetical protein